MCATPEWTQDWMTSKPIMKLDKNENLVFTVMKMTVDVKKFQSPMYNVMSLQLKSHLSINSDAKKVRTVDL